MLNQLMIAGLVAALVPLGAIVIFRMLGRTKRTRRPVHSFPLGAR